MNQIVLAVFLINIFSAVFLGGYFIFVLYQIFQKKDKIELSDRKYFVAVALILLFAAFLRFSLAYNYQGNLWDDEARTYVTVSADTVSGMLELRKHMLPDNAPLDLIIRNFFMQSFGNTIENYFYPSIIFSLATLALLAVLAKSFMPKKYALGVLLLMATNAYDIAYSLSGRNYEILAFLTVLNLVFFLDAVDKGGKVRWIAYSLTLVLSFYAHYIMFALLFVHVSYVAYLLWKQKGESRTVVLGYVLATSAAVAASIPLILSYIQRLMFFLETSKQLNGTIGKTSSSDVSAGITIFLVLNYFGLHLGISVYLLILHRAPIKFSKEAVLLVLYLIIGFAFPYTAVKTFLVTYRYFHYLLPVTTILTVLILKKICALLLGKTKARSKNTTLLIFITLLSLTAFISSYANKGSLDNNYLNFDGDWKETAEFIESNYVEGDVVLVLNNLHASLEVFADIPLYVNEAPLDTCDGRPKEVVERISETGDVDWRTFNIEDIEENSTPETSPRYWIVFARLSPLYDCENSQSKYVVELESKGYEKVLEKEGYRIRTTLYAK